MVKRGGCRSILCNRKIMEGLRKNEMTFEQKLEFCMAELRKSVLFDAGSDEELEAFAARLAEEEYIDITTDWGFKYFFGNHKDILMMLLNDILPEKIVDLSYSPQSTVKRALRDKQVIFDVYAVSEDGRRLIVEMQKRGRSDMRDRILYYLAELVVGQMQAGNAPYVLSPSYVICIMDYEMEHSVEAGADQLVFEYNLSERTTQELFSDKVGFYMLELPRLQRFTGDARSPVAQWFALIKNIAKFAHDRDLGRFATAVATARVGGLTEQELKNYFSTMISERDRIAENEYSFQQGYKKAQRDIIAENEYSFQQGYKKAREEAGAASCGYAKNMLSDGVPIETVSRYTGLSVEKLRELL